MIIVLAGLLSYHNSLTGPLVFDDHLSIAENPTLRSISSAWVPPRGQGATVEGRPLLNVSLAVSRALSPTGTAGFHALNLGIHLAAALALLGLTRRTLLLPTINVGLRRHALTLAAGVALLWVVHPLQTESVTYIVQRAESQMGLFFLLTLYLFVRGCEPGARGGIWFSFAIVACWLGAATKEVMVAAPVLAWLYDRSFIAGRFGAAWRARWRAYVGLFSSWLLVAALVWSSGSRGGTVGFSAQVGWWDYTLTQCDAIARYLSLAIWPHPLVFDYGAEAQESLAAVAPQAILVVGLVLSTLVALVRAPQWGFLGVWFLAMLAPTSLIPGNRQTIAEHRMYLSLAAVIAAEIVVLAMLLGSIHLRRASRVVIVLAVLGMGFGLMTFRRNADYESEIRLYRDTVAKRPRNGFAHYNLGKLLAESGQPAPAIPAYEAALKVRPAFPAAQFNLGNVHFELGHLPQAEAAIRAAIALQFDYAEAHYNLGNVLIQAERKAEAAESFRNALQARPDFYAARENLGTVLVEMGQLEAARTEFVTVLQAQPQSVPARFGLGNIWFLSGRMQEAVAEYEQVVRTAPNLDFARQQLENARSRLGGGR